MTKVARFRRYNKSFFDGMSDASYAAAKVLLPEVHKLYPFKSVVDFGCGSGTWLRAAAETIGPDHGPLTGIDGEYARDIVHCAGATWVFQDMEQPITVDRHDLAISLEVAEHLTAARGRSFVEDICSAADVVFFSAAVVGQGGTNHINEQPQSYWMRIFDELGYQPFVFYRTQHWDDPVFELCPYYVAGSFLYIRKGHPLFTELDQFKVGPDDLVDVVHPNLLRWRSDENLALRWHVSQLVPSFVRAVKRRSPDG